MHFFTGNLKENPDINVPNFVSSNLVEGFLIQFPYITHSAK